MIYHGDLVSYHQISFNKITNSDTHINEGGQKVCFYATNFCSYFVDFFFNEKTWGKIFCSTATAIHRKLSVDDVNILFWPKGDLDEQTDGQRV